MRRFLFIAVFPFTFFFSYSQNNNKIDSLSNLLKSELADTSRVTILNKISQEYLKSDFDKAFENAQNALILAKNINDKKSIALSYTYISYAQYRLSKFEDAEININKALTIYEIINDKLKISKCYSFISQVHYAQQEFDKAIELVNKSIQIKLDNNLINELEINYLTLGAIYQKQGKYKLALSNFFKAVDYYDKNNNSNNKASVYNNIAVTYRKLNDLESAINYYNKSLELNIKNNDKFGELKIYNNMAVIYEQQMLTEKAISNYQKVLKLSNKIGFEGGIAMSQINLAGIYIESEKNIEKAKQLLENAEKICIKINDNYKLIFAYGLQGQFYQKNNNLRKAIFYSEKAYHTAFKINASKDIADLALQLSELYKEQKEFKKSLKYFEIFHKTNDSIFNHEKTVIIQEMKNRFEIDAKNAELKIKTTKIEILEKEQKIKTLKNYGLIAGIILIIFLTLFIYVFLRNKISKNKLLNKKKHELYEYQQDILKLEVQNKEFEKQQLSKEIEYKNKELQNFAHYIIDKNEFIIKIQHDLRKVKKNISEKNIDNSLQSVLTDINNKIQIVRNSEEFLAHVDQINNNFYCNLKEMYPDISENEQRLASLLKIGLLSKDIASILHITPKSVDTNRYRLRKKLNLEQDINLNEFFKNL